MIIIVMKMSRIDKTCFDLKPGRIYKLEVTYTMIILYGIEASIVRWIVYAGFVKSPCEFTVSDVV